MHDALIEFLSLQDNCIGYFVQPIGIHGHLLRRLRNFRGLSQAGISIQSGLSTSFISHCENGTALTSISTAERVCKVLEVPLHTLYACSAWLSLLHPESIVSFALKNENHSI